MSTVKRVLGGCVAVPVLLVTSCAGKMYVDYKLYQLPGATLQSSEKATRRLDSAVQVAEALDSYVQPRFEILRDKNFGAFRITYRKHAGIVQLKVDTPEEKQIIANVNAANRDYTINLLHCAPRPPQTYSSAEPRLEMLYYNQDHGLRPRRVQRDPAAEERADFGEVRELAVQSARELRAGHERRMETASWQVLMRPVLATKQACLGCHTEARIGDTLGAMVYTVRRSKRGEKGALSMR